MPTAPGAGKAGTSAREPSLRRAYGSRGRSGLHQDEPVAGVEHTAVAELLRQRRRLEDRLRDLPPRPPVQDPLLLAGRLLALVETAAQEDELAGDAARLGEEPHPLGLLEVAVEVAREQAVEGAVGERERERVALDERRRRRLPPC